MVKCQRINGVKLIDGKDDGKSAREYIECLATAVREKISSVLKSTAFFSVLSDGSQPKKVKSEKELIMSRCERNGSPTYFTLALLEMSE